jgi:hypothetical protein
MLLKWQTPPLIALLSTVLAEDAIRSAIRDYRSKRADLAGSKAKQAGFIDVTQSSSGETTTSHSAA